MQPVPRIVIRSIAAGLFLMALFTMIWTGIAQGGLAGRDDYMSLAIFAAFSISFVVYGIFLLRQSNRFPALTTDAEKAEGKRMGKWYGIIFGLEGVLIPLVAGGLVALHHPDLIIPGIALVVGLHFYPMARVFNRTIDYYLATWATLIAIAGIVLTLRQAISQPTLFAITGIGMSLATASYGVFMIVEGKRLLTSGTF